MLNSLCNTPRSRLGLSSLLSGTGFAFKISALPESKWQTKTFIEDVEFDIQQTLKGNIVKYVPSAIFYDEQPSTLGTMFKQLSRWCTGGAQMPRFYFRKWLRAFGKHPSQALFDSFFFINMNTFVCLSLLLNGILNISYFLNNDLMFLQSSAIFTVIFTLLTILVGFAAAWQVRWPIHKLLPGILTYPLFSLIFSLISIYSLISPQKEWQKIEHGQTTAELRSYC